MGGNLPDERSDHLEGFLPVDVQKGVRKVGLGMIRAFQIGAYGHQGTGMSRGVQFRSEGNAVEAGKGDQLGDLFPRVMLGRGDAGIFLTRDAVVGSTVVPRVVVQVQVQFVHFDPGQGADVLAEHFRGEVFPGDVEHDHASGQHGVIRDGAFGYGEVRGVLGKHLQQGARSVKESFVAFGPQFDVISDDQLVSAGDVGQRVGEGVREAYLHALGRGFYSQGREFALKEGVQLFCSRVFYSREFGADGLQGQFAGGSLVIAHGGDDFGLGIDTLGREFRPA